jgi:hypothetical protein
MPLLLGLKQLPSGAQILLGWQVLLCGSNEAVGTVLQVGASCWHANVEIIVAVLFVEGP